MQESLKSKLEQTEKDRLIEIIETLCQVKENEQLLKALLMPDKQGVDRLIGKFSRYAEAFMENPSSGRAYDNMLDSMEPIYSALKYADNRLSAYIISEVYQAAMENDLFEIDCDDFVFDLLEDLRYILENAGDAFSDEEMLRYRSIIEE